MTCKSEEFGGVYIFSKYDIAKIRLFMIEAIFYYENV